MALRAPEEVVARNGDWSRMSMSNLERPTPRPGVMAIHAYVPGKSSAPGVAKVYKLSSNETPLGPSPRAVEAYREVAGHLQDYPDGSATDLREAIGRAFGLRSEERRVGKEC